LRFLYTILFYLALPIIFLRLLWRSLRIPGYRKNWGERLGFCSHRFEGCIWIHVVSVGETIAAQPLIKAVIQEYPHLPVLLTNMTPTGAARVKAIFGDTAKQAFIPYDLPDAVARFLSRTKPKIAIIFETELWPNLFYACRKRHIPVLVMNARLSEKSARGYGSIAGITKQMFQAITHLAVQAPKDAERFLRLGFPKERMSVTGNIKFDLEIPVLESTEFRESLGLARKVWIAASTHPTEEEIIFRAHQLIKEKYPHVLLILAPRHPDRIHDIMTLAKTHGFSFVRRSQKEVCTNLTDIYFADTLGELLFMYSLCDVAFVGGSFAQIGGHNLMEPAALAKPIVSGPVLYNFSEVSQLLLNAKGLTIVNNAGELAEKVLRFFSEDFLAKTAGQNAYQVVIENKGALQKQFDLIKITLTK
jgi:3-deoxy-D-manno-octulosonic-acid transferase